MVPSVKYRWNCREMEMGVFLVNLMGGLIVSCNCGEGLVDKGYCEGAITVILYIRLNI